MTRFTPRGQDPSTFHALVDGIPSWMRADARLWLTRSQRFVDLDHLLRGFDRDTRREHPIAGNASAGAEYVFISKLSSDQERLDLLEYFLYYFEAMELPQLAEVSRNLEDLLESNSSKWRVGTRNGYVGLEERVPAGVKAAADHAMAQGAAGQILAEAWVALFSRSPDYEEAYEKAIKSVEEAGVPIVSPNNSKATLGTMVAQMEQQPAPRWGLPLQQNAQHPTGDTVTQMMRALWHGQESRHGGNGYRKPTREEAEAAILLAVPLLQWFTSGVIARRP